MTVSSPTADPAPAEPRDGLAARTRRWLRSSRPRNSSTLARAADGSRDLNNFDVLRLFAACLVFGHSFDLLRIPEPFTPLKGFGWGTFGVLIFFSISGFLVTRSWERNPRLIPFTVKRGLRLLPGLVVALLLTALVLGPLVSVEPAHTYFREPATKAYILNNATLQIDYYLPGVSLHTTYPLAVSGSLWTLPVEVKAYVIVALLGLVTLKLPFRRTVWVAAAMFATLVCIAAVRPSIPLGDQFVAWLVDVQAGPGIIHAAKLGGFTIFAELFAVCNYSGV